MILKLPEGRTRPPRGPAAGLTCDAKTTNYTSGGKCLWGGASALEVFRRDRGERASATLLKKVRMGRPEIVPPLRFLTSAKSSRSGAFVSEKRGACAEKRRAARFLRGFWSTESLFCARCWWAVRFVR